MSHITRFHPYRRPILPAPDMNQQPPFPSTNVTQAEVNRNHLRQTMHQEQLTLHTLSLTNFPPWQPSPYAKRILHQLHEIYFHQYPCVPCAYCSILMHPQKAFWIEPQPGYLYPLTETFPHLQPKKHPNRNAIAICNLCKNPSTRRTPPQVGDIPQEIKAVPQSARPYLSPISLNCSLGRTTADGNVIHNAYEHNVNNFMTYRFLSGTFGFSKNPRAHALYSGTIGAFLQSDLAAGWQSHIYHESL